MISALLIAAVVLLYTMQSFFTKKYSDNYPGEREMSTPVFTIVSGFIVIVVSFCFSGFSFEFNWLTMLFGIFNAVVLFGYNHFLINASARGSYSVVMIFSLAGGIIVPAIVMCFFGEIPSMFQVLTMIIILEAVYLVSLKPEEKKKAEMAEGGKKNSFVFILMCIGLFLCNGAYGALLSVQQQFTGAAQKEEMVAFTYLGAMITALITMLIKKKGRIIKPFRQNGRSLTFLLITSLIVALAINALVYVLNIVDDTLLYTFDNAGVMLMSVLASCIFFKEKLSRWNIIGCVAMCVALVAFALLGRGNIEAWGWPKFLTFGI